MPTAGPAPLVGVEDEGGWVGRGIGRVGGPGIMWSDGTGRGGYCHPWGLNRPPAATAAVTVGDTGCGWEGPPPPPPPPPPPVVPRGGAMTTVVGGIVAAAATVVVGGSIGASIGMGTSEMGIPSTISPVTIWWC